MKKSIFTAFALGTLLSVNAFAQQAPPNPDVHVTRGPEVLAQVKQYFPEQTQLGQNCNVKTTYDSNPEAVTISISDSSGIILADCKLSVNDTYLTSTITASDSASGEVFPTFNNMDGDPNPGVGPNRSCSVGTFTGKQGFVDVINVKPSQSAHCQLN